METATTTKQTLSISLALSDSEMATDVTINGVRFEEQTTEEVQKLVRNAVLLAVKALADE